MRTKLFLNQKVEKMLDKQDHIIAGISGGADSVCLFFVLLEWQKERAFRLEVVHIDHGIRGIQSKEDADFVKALCKRHQVPFHLYQYDVPELAKEEKLSLEETARNCRYKAFEEVRSLVGGTKIAVAHNKEDQAETILMNLVRGSGLAGLSGMRAIHGKLIRPLLGYSRKEIESYLLERNISWRTDSTNLETKYTRNKVRQEIIPRLQDSLNHQAVEHIVEAGQHVLKAQEFLIGESVIRAKRIGKMQDEQVWLGRVILLQETEIMQEYILRQWLKWLGAGLRDIGMVHIGQMRALAAGHSGKQIDLPGDYVCKCTGEFLVLRKKLIVTERGEATPLVMQGETRYGKWRVFTEIEPFVNQEIQEKKYTKWLDYGTMTATAHVRSRQEGDYFYIAEGSKKLKKYFIDEKILEESRSQIPLIAIGNHIIWIVGHRISERCKVTAETKRILKIQIVEDSYEPKD